MLGGPLHAQGAGVFEEFTSHIYQQVNKDKVGFARASMCTEWFYKEAREKKHRPRAEGIAYKSPDTFGTSVAQQNVPSRNCPSHYPGGIQEARKDFGHTQSILTISLTFYQFALVGDRNDDRHYNADELRDILESMNLPFNTILPSPLHATTLNDTFDSLHHMENLDQLVTGMGRLLDQGYRLTGQDQLALNRIMG